MREIKVTATWRSTHTLEVPDDTPRINHYDLDAAIQASGEDVQPDHSCELWDWEVEDRG